MDETQKTNDPVLSYREAAKYIDIPHGTMWSHHRRGKTPPFDGTYIGRKGKVCAGWKRSTVDAFRDTLSIKAKPGPKPKRNVDAVTAKDFIAGKFDREISRMAHRVALSNARKAGAVTKTVRLCGDGGW